jgi:hypothetical protein
MIWKGKYSENSVEVNFSVKGWEGETDLVGFVFRKKNNCIELDYAYYSFFGGCCDGSSYSLLSVNYINIDSFTIQEYIEDDKLVGQITFLNPNTQTLVTIKFSYIFTPDDYFDSNISDVTFNDCFDTNFSINIDLNSDNINDFSITHNETDLLPDGTTHTIQINSLNENTISTKYIFLPHKIIFEPPFSSFISLGSNDITNHNLGRFSEYTSPLQNFNYWHSTEGATYNNIDDYIIVKVEKDGLFYYGWIKIKIDYEDCIFEIVETYINPTPNEHISVN